MMFIMTYPYNLKKKNSVCFWFVSNLHMLFFHSSIPYTQFISFNYIFHLEYFLHSFILIFLFNLIFLVFIFGKYYYFSNSNISHVYLYQVTISFHLGNFLMPIMTYLNIT